MKPIVRATGATPSEVFLAQLAEKTFLDLWSYSNTFTKPGKELCDLLVVFGDDIIIFSDKSIGWPAADVGVAWPRWYKRAIEKSANQIRGAERALRERPQDVFLDAACANRLPLALPPLERRRVHGVCVAFGAENACRTHFDDPDGTLIIAPSVMGQAHAQPTFAFMVGDVDPTGPFVHVFDRTSLEVVMKEMSTISDFVNYIRKRAEFIRSGNLMVSPGEAEMVAHYLMTTREDGSHDFPNGADLGATGPYKLTFVQGDYTALVENPQYIARNEADKVSYVWDTLITEFTKHIIGGTSAKITDDEPSAELAEPALRFMAAENRTSRRGLSRAILGAMETAERVKQDRFARVIRPGAGAADPDLAYVLMILSLPKELA